MSEQAGRWIRVSTGRQDEKSQLPDVDGWCDSHDYGTSPDTLYQLHGASASKGKQDKMWRRVLDDMRAGRISVLVCWKLDRLDRRGILASLAMVQQARDAGGRVEFATEPQYNGANAELQQAFGAYVAKLESDTKSDRSKAKHAALKAAGSFVGRPPFGYSLVETLDGIKVIEPNSDAALVKFIFERIAAGESLRDVGELLSMWPRTVQVIIRRETYKGRHHHGADVLTVPAIVSAELWRRANDRLTGTTRGRRGRSEGRQQALLTSVLYCGPCHDRGIESPMYRSGNGSYYRCTGTGPKRRGCGNMIQLDQVEYQAVTHLAADRRKRTITISVADSRADRIESARDALQDAMNARPMDAARVAALAAEVAQIEAEAPTGPTSRTIETGETIGQHWQGLGRDERRAWLLRDGWRMWAWKPTGKADAPMLAFVPGYSMAA